MMNDEFQNSSFITPRSSFSTQAPSLYPTVPATSHQQNRSESRAARVKRTLQERVPFDACTQSRCLQLAYSALRVRCPESAIRLRRSTSPFGLRPLPSDAESGRASPGKSRHHRRSGKKPLSARAAPAFSRLEPHSPVVELQPSAS